MQILMAFSHLRACLRVMLIAYAVVAAMTGWSYATSSIAYSASERIAAGAKVGRAAPLFSVPSLTGGQVTLAQFIGRPLVITFFFSECRVCWPDMSLLEEAYGRYRSRGLAIVGVGMQDPVNALRQMIKSLNVTFPVGYDDKGAVAGRYRLTALPTTVFVGTDGLVKSILKGNLDDRSLQRSLAMILPRSASAR